MIFVIKIPIKITNFIINMSALHKKKCRERARFGFVNGKNSFQQRKLNDVVNLFLICVVLIKKTNKTKEYVLNNYHLFIFQECLEYYIKIIWKELTSSV